MKRIVFVALIAALILGCELEETIRINADGSGTYTGRFAVEKQFAAAFANMKTEAKEKGYVIVEQSDTADRHIVVIKREFKSISEIDDSSDHYTLRIEKPGALKTKYFLHVVSTPSAFGGFQQRTLHLTMPVSITIASAGTVSGSHVDWDATHGGVLDVEAEGIALPFGMSAILIAIIVAALLVVLLMLRKRGGAAVPRVCGACQTPAAAGAKFCGKGGAPLA